MKKIIAFLAAIVAATPAYADTEFRWAEEHLDTINDELIVYTSSNLLTVNRINKQIWFTPKFFANDTTGRGVQLYPYFNEDKTEITFTTEEKDLTFFRYNCNTVKGPQTYTGTYLTGGTTAGLKDTLCSRYIGDDWEIYARRNDDEKHEGKDFSLRLRYSSIGYMDVEFHPKNFTYDPEKDMVYVPWRARHTEGEVRYTVDGSWKNKTFHREDTFGRFLGTPSGTYAITCKDTFLGRLQRINGKPYTVEDPNSNKLELAKLHHFTQNRICKYKNEYKEVYKAR